MLICLCSYVIMSFKKKSPKANQQKPSGDSSKQTKKNINLNREICSPVAGLPRLHSLSIFLSHNAPKMTPAISVRMPSVIIPF